LFTRRILPPGATIAFLLFGVVVVVSDALHMDLSQWPVWARATTNLVYLGGCVGAMLFVVIRITG
jgi:hypothetical protein